MAGFDGRIVHVNPRIANFFGYTTEEILALSLDELIYAEDRVVTTGVFQQLISGESTHGLEVRVRTKDGGHKWILWNGVPSVADQLIFATGQDITERKRIEDELRESEERFALIANTTKEAVWDWDLRTDRLWRNEAYSQTFGVHDDQLREHHRVVAQADSPRRRRAGLGPTAASADRRPAKLAARISVSAPRRHVRAGARSRLCDHRSRRQTHAHGRLGDRHLAVATCRGAVARK